MCISNSRLGLGLGLAHALAHNVQELAIQSSAVSVLGVLFEILVEKP